MEDAETQSAVESGLPVETIPDAVPVSEPDPSQWTALLFAAVEADDLEAIRTALDSGASANVRKKITLTAHVTPEREESGSGAFAEVDNEEMKEDEIEGESLLAVAIIKGNVEIVSMLLKGGANINAKCEWKVTDFASPFWTTGDWEERWRQSFAYHSALHLALSEGPVELNPSGFHVKLVDPKEKSETSVEKVLQPSPEIVRLICDHEDVQITENDAVRAGRIGGEVEQTVNRQFLVDQLYRHLTGQPEASNDAGADNTNNSGEAVVTSAENDDDSEEGEEEEEQEDDDSVSGDTKGPAPIAGGDAESAEKTSDPTADLIRAIETHNVEAVKAAIRRGANVNACKKVTLRVEIDGATKKDTCDAESILALAVMHENLEIAKEVLDAGCDIHAPVSWKLAEYHDSWSAERWEKNHWFLEYQFPSICDLVLSSAHLVTPYNDIRQQFTRLAVQRGCLAYNKKGPHPLVRDPQKPEQVCLIGKLEPSLAMLKLLLERGAQASTTARARARKFENREISDFLESHFRQLVPKHRGEYTKVSIDVPLVPGGTDDPTLEVVPSTEPGADVDEIDTLTIPPAGRGPTPDERLIVALESRRLDLVRGALRDGASPHARKRVQLNVRFGMDVKRDEIWAESAIALAVLYGEEAFIDELCKAGADLNREVGWRIPDFEGEWEEERWNNGTRYAATYVFPSLIDITLVTPQFFSPFSNITRDFGGMLDERVLALNKDGARVVLDTPHNRTQACDFIRIHPNPNIVRILLANGAQVSAGAMARAKTLEDSTILNMLQEHLEKVTPKPPARVLPTEDVMESHATEPAAEVDAGVEAGSEETKASPTSPVPPGEHLTVPQGSEVRSETTLTPPTLAPEEAAEPVAKVEVDPEAAAAAEQELRNQRLIDAIEVGRLDKVKDALKRGANPRARKKVHLRATVQGETKEEKLDAESALALAILRGSESMARELLDAGADPNADLGWKIANWGDEAEWNRTWDNGRWAATLEFSSSLDIAMVSGTLSSPYGNVLRDFTRMATDDFAVATNKPGYLVSLRDPEDPKAAADFRQAKPDYTMVRTLLTYGAQISQAARERARRMEDKAFSDLIEAHLRRRTAARGTKQNLYIEELRTTMSHQQARILMLEQELRATKEVMSSAVGAAGGPAASMTASLEQANRMVALERTVSELRDELVKKHAAGARQEAELRREIARFIRDLRARDEQLRDAREQVRRMHDAAESSQRIIQLQEILLGQANVAAVAAGGAEPPPYTPVTPLSATFTRLLSRTGTQLRQPPTRGSTSGGGAGGSVGGLSGARVTSSRSGTIGGGVGSSESMNSSTGGVGGAVTASSPEFPRPRRTLSTSSTASASGQSALPPPAVDEGLPPRVAPPPAFSDVARQAEGDPLHFTGAQGMLAGEAA
ncbi:hypothetical protein M427DRAFT_151861 [Gonapodya prolifera JEL478]|uniref:Ankyrin n=1 Tax=Gonapodya prolifera (strain JEL478) TaxID=1344416 RepID=A0A139AV25_GONPJ|nr:hypothetical protein M427DRAFT_151861 [Gonapodya prolifera JEL478]|eukprot:KXS20554.1 hypothetical protein M427DRAFT_151861 [Gonapodya prolifera JEL478]